MIPSLCLSSLRLGDQDGVIFWLPKFTVPLYTAGAELLKMGLRRKERDKSGFLSTTPGNHLKRRKMWVKVDSQDSLLVTCMFTVHHTTLGTVVGTSRHTIYCCAWVSLFLWVSFSMWKLLNWIKKGNYWFHPTHPSLCMGAGFELSATV